MSFKPFPTRIGSWLLAIVLAAILAIIFFINRLPMQDELPAMFALFIGILVAFGVIIAAIACSIIPLTLRYQINRNGIIIHWGFAQQRIPLNSVEEIVSGRGVAEPSNFKGINLAGLRLGKGQLSEYGQARFFTTTALANSLVLATNHGAYVISPLGAEAFLRAWRERQKLGITQNWAVEMRRNWPFTIPILADWLSWSLFGLGAVACLGLFGYLAFAFADLPRTVPIRFDALGQISRTVDKAFLFLFPTIGAGLLLVNLVLGALAYQQERLAAYLSWGGAVVVQLCLWVAVYTIVNAT